MRCKRVRNLLPLLVAILAACSPDSPLNAGRFPGLSPSLEVLLGAENGITLVQAPSTSALASARGAIAARGGRIIREIPALRLMYASGLDQAGVAAINVSGVTSAGDRLVRMTPEPASAFRASRTLSSLPGAAGTDQSTAAFFSLQWNLRSIRADRAWSLGRTGSGELVCVLDSGIDPHHIDLSGAVDMSRSFTAILIPRFASDATVLDFNSHGTFVAGLVRTQGRGIASTASDARLCAIKVLSEDGAGTFGDILFAISEAARMGADVVNLSLTGIVDAFSPGGAFLISLLEAVVADAREQGTVIIAAAGNNGLNFDDIHPRFVVVPAMIRGVVSVGATAPIAQLNFDVLASYSNFGATRTLDLVAPGGDFVLGGVVEDLVLSVCSQYQTTLPFSCAGGTTVLFGAGTSFAAPLVAAAAAVAESGSPSGSLRSQDLERCLLRADRLSPLWKFGRGRLNVVAARNCVAPT
ncbi:MAG: S8 family serine peptidase [Gemmatimonadota bacterium]